MLDFRSLTSQDAGTIPIWTTSGVRALAAAMGVANLILVARALGPERRGSLAIAEAVVGLIVVLAGGWLGSLTSVRAARDRTAIPHLVTFNIWWSLAAGAMLSAVIVVAYPQVQALGFLALDQRELYAALFGSPAQIFNTAATGLMLGSGRVRAFNLVALLQANAYLPALGALTLASRVDVWTLLAAASVIQYALAAGILIFYWRASRVWGELSAVDLQGHLRFGGKLALTSVAAFVVARSGVLLLDAFGTDASVGTYAVASRIGDMLMFIPNTVCGIVLARLSASPDRAFRYAETVRFAKQLTGIVAAVAVTIALAGPWAIPLVFGREYSSSYLPLVVLLPGLIFLTAELVLAQNLAAAGVPRAVVGLWFLVAALSVGLGVLLVPRLGPIGVALSATATYGALLLGIWRIHARLRT